MSNIMKNFYKFAAALLLGTGFLAVSCNQKEEKTYMIGADPTVITDIAANNPSAEVVVVSTDAPYWIATTTEDWISVDPVQGLSGETIVTLTFTSNYKNEGTTTAPRSGSVKFSGGMTSVTVNISQLGHEAVIDPSASIGGIPDLEEFIKFRDAVNDGNVLTRWTNDNGEIALLADIDLGAYEEWEPVGLVSASGNANNASKAVGAPFTGVFNGGGHKISNFNVSATLAEGTTWGLFGYISNATVKNLEVEAKVTLSAAGVADAGIVVGTAYGSTIENVKVKGTVKSTGTTASARFAVGGIAGFIFAPDDATSGTTLNTTVKGCTADLEVDVDGGSNTANGATCAMYGGIVAFATNDKGTSRNYIEDCINNGSIKAKVGRCSGIVPTANGGTVVRGCTNNASQLNTIANGRIGQIVCNLAADSGVIDCVNNGDLTTTGNQTTAGGLVALLGNASAYVEGGANYGTIIAGFDPATDGQGRRFTGLLFANVTNLDHVSDVVASGRLGVYKADGNHEMYEITQENYMTYALGGKISDANLAKVSGITYVAK